MIIVVVADQGTASVGIGLGSASVAGRRIGNVDAAGRGMTVREIVGIRTGAGRGRGRGIAMTRRRIAEIRSATVAIGRRGSPTSGRGRLRSRKSPSMVST